MRSMARKPLAWKCSTCSGVTVSVSALIAAHLTRRRSSDTSGIALACANLRTVTGGPLDDIRVLELANWLAAPSCAALMADMGAEVVKVEPLSGDGMRRKLRQPVSPEGVAAH